MATHGMNKSVSWVSMRAWCLAFTSCKVALHSHREDGPFDFLWSKTLLGRVCRVKQTEHAREEKEKKENSTRDGAKEEGRDGIVKGLIRQRDRESLVQEEERKYRCTLLKLALAVSCLLIKALIWLVEGKQCGRCGDKTSELNATPSGLWECPQSFT